MSQELVNTLLNQAVETITENLEALSLDADASAIEAAIETPVKDAFDALNAPENADDLEADVTALYKKLSLKFHPDKLPTYQAPYAVKLRQLAERDAGFMNIPQQIIVKYKSGSLREAFDDLDAADLESVVNFLQAVRAAVQQFLNEYLRYPAPIDMMVGIAHFILFIGLGLAAGAAAVSVAILAGITRAVNNTLLNVMTGYHYDDELDEHVTTESMAKFARYELRAYIPGIDNAEDADAIAIYIDSFIQQHSLENNETNRGYGMQHLKNQVKDGYSLLERQAIIFSAFSAAITKPLPGGVVNNLASIMLRAAQCLLVIPALLMDAAHQVIQTLRKALIISILVVALLSFSAFVLLTNMPLYIYDACVAATTYISSLVENMVSPATPEPVAPESTTPEPVAPESTTPEPVAPESEAPDASSWSGWLGSFFSSNQATDDTEGLETASVASYGSTNNID